MSVTAARRREASTFKDQSYPVDSPGTARAALKLRHHSKTHSAAEVIAHVSAWETAHPDPRVRRQILKAKQADRDRSKG